MWISSVQYINKEFRVFLYRREDLWFQVPGDLRFVFKLSAIVFSRLQLYELQHLWGSKRENRTGKEKSWEHGFKSSWRRIKEEWEAVGTQRFVLEWQKALPKKIILKWSNWSVLFPPAEPGSIGESKYLVRWKLLWMFRDMSRDPWRMLKNDKKADFAFLRFILSLLHSSLLQHVQKPKIIRQEISPLKNISDCEPKH